MSNTQNVKVGVARAYYKGRDLGYTQGGIEVNISTETHKVLVDQFGKTPINDIILGRTCETKLPLAETTLTTMLAIMPGAKLTLDGGAKVTGSITFGGPCVEGDNVNVLGVVWTFTANPVGEFDVAIGISASDQATKFVAAVQASSSTGVEDLVFAAAGAVVTMTGATVGAKLNGKYLVPKSAQITVSAFAGGQEPTAARVDIPTGIGIDLLSIAGELRLHPKALLDTDQSEDFIIPFAATSGAVQFSYNLEKERIFNVTFMAYPDPYTDRLASYGSPLAV